MRWYLILLITAALTACSANVTDKQAAQVEGTNTTDNTQRLIISFVDPDIDPMDQQLIQTLAADLQGNIKFVRKLSGNANLYLCETEESDALFSERLNKLGARDDIAYAEPDFSRKTQSSK